nr:tandem-95 repeat protein [Desulfobulbaceae bacterium]
MSKKILSFFCALIVGGQLSVAQAELLPLTVNWSYSGSAAAYILYKDGLQVCSSSDPVAEQMTCNVFIEDVPMIFTLTAVDTDGIESPQSAPYTLNPPVQDSYGNYIPQPSITVDVSAGEAPLAVSFDASGSIDVLGSINSYEWSFGDGSTGTGQFINHSFTAPGSYLVTLTVVDNQAASAEATVTITVNDPGVVTLAPNVAPVALITATPIPNLTSRIGFDAYSSSDTDGTIAAFSWDFGDGDTAAGEYVEHEFLVVGDYTVVLTIVDDEGASAQDQMIISVVEPPIANTPPVAAVSASTTQHRLHFDWEYTVSPDLAGFNLYQNGIPICNVPDATARQADCLAFVDSGIVEFWLTSYDVNGVETAPSEIFIFDSSAILPVAVTGDAPFSVHFSSGGTFDVDGTIVSYEWGFGDGTIATGSTVEHTFDLPGTYTVTLTVTDDAGDSAQATTEITVTGIINLPPTVTGGAFTTDENKSITASLSAFDPEGEQLSFILTENGSLGTATITNTTSGLFTYVPKTGVSGSDTFTFKVNDGLQDSALAQVAITIVNVNSVPVAQPVSVSTSEDTSVIGQLNGSDSDSDPLTYTIITAPVNGTVALSDATSPQFTYSPNADFNGTDSFTYLVNDGVVNSAPATVSITISPVNDVPIAADDFATTDEDTSVSIDVLANDSDIDGDPLTVVAVTTGGNGTVSLSGSTIIYTPSADFYGIDTFSYAIGDGHGGISAPATVTITVRPVNDFPVVQAVSVTVVSGAMTVIDVLQTASDIDGDTLAISSVTASANAVALIVNGSIEYTANPGFWGDDTLAYTISDGKGAETSGVVTVTVEQPMSQITFSWDFDPAVSVKGFNFYRNGTKICGTQDTAIREFSCTAPVVEGHQSFAITAIDSAGIESTLSNLIQYGVVATQTVEPPPAPVPEPEQLVTYSWTYTGDATTLLGFRLYMNGTAICDTSDPGARSLNCKIPLTSDTKIFTVTSIDKDGVESAFSNSIQY